MEIKNLTIIGFVLAALIEVILVPIYIVCLGNKKPYKLKKMICSTLFILCAIFAVIYQGGFTFFSVAMLIGLVLSWIGDLFLAVSLKGTMFVCGLASFLLAHVAYVVSYTRAISNVSESGAGIKLYELLIVSAMLIMCLIVKKKAKIKLDEMAIPVLLYALTISSMLARAIRLGVECAVVGDIHVCILMIVAAVSFVISDAVLVFIIFKNMHSGKTEGTNLISYYLAQVLLAGSIFFLG
ncbi:MAG: lysoplasmalogenase [Faecalibacterium sp.]|nr:lysoplasmalogenase [Ruminococcus sp.]MCM1393091.1 lysoplasmalogenase [Ruminococcus sp.]MCM1485186.1 lysoplasmalogenase [Faecalibacterium sp.]